MRKNKQIKCFDRVYRHLPDELRKVRTVIACPLKTIYINTNADEDANVDRLFTSAEDLSTFIKRHGIRGG